MKHSNLIAGFLLALAFTLIGSIACSSIPGETQQKNIATACAGITAAVNAIAAGAETGKVSKANAATALAIARPTASFCEPKPADHLSPTDYAALLSAAADLTARKEKLR